MPESQATLPPLISADRLGAMLGAPRLVILDASWYLPATLRDPDAEYRSAHIPGAIRFPLEKVCDPDSDLPHMVPSPERFAEACESRGVGPGHQLVIYDGSGVNMSAARAWWLFRLFGHRAVSVLDGGIRAWAGATRPIQTGEHRRPPTGYPVPTLDTSLVVSKAEVEAIAAGDADGQLVDCRSVNRFEGKEDEPRPGLRSGHIPGSVNMPFPSFTNRETGRMFAVPVLKEMFSAEGLDLQRRIVATCGSGVSACVAALAVEEVRVAEPASVGPPVAIYDGSWAEWGK